MEDGDYFTEDGYYYTADGYDENGGYFDEDQGKYIIADQDYTEEELKRMDEEADEEEKAYQGIGDYTHSKLGIHNWDKPKKGCNSAAKQVSQQEALEMPNSFKGVKLKKNNHLLL